MNDTIATSTNGNTVKAVINFVGTDGFVYSTRVNHSVLTKDAVVSELDSFRPDHRAVVAERIFGFISNYSHIDRIEKFTITTKEGDRIPGTELVIVGVSKEVSDSAEIIGRVKGDDDHTIFGGQLDDAGIGIVFDLRHTGYLTYFWNSRDYEGYDVIDHRSVPLTDLH